MEIVICIFAVLILLVYLKERVGDTDGFAEDMQRHEQETALFLSGKGHSDI